MTSLPSAKFVLKIRHPITREAPCHFSFPIVLLLLLRCCCFTCSALLHKFLDTFSSITRNKLLEQR